MSVAHADITATEWIAITSRRSSTAQALPKPPLVLVVGMPRSGLSLLRDLLAGLGLSVMDAGCAEQLVTIQDRLLIDLERWWPSRQATQALPNHHKPPQAPTSHHRPPQSNTKRPQSHHRASVGTCESHHQTGWAQPDLMILTK